MIETCGRKRRPWLFSATLVILCFLPRVRNDVSRNGTMDDLDALDQLLKTYDRRALPQSHLGVPTTVECEIYIRSFGSINPATMDYAVDLYLRQSWLDQRLRRDNSTRPLDLNDPKLVQKIWKPEVFFPNAKDADFQYVTVPNVLVRVKPEGKILYMLRLKLRFSCMMDLYRYPMDTQICTIELASFSKTVEELVLQWSKGKPIILYENLKLPQFEIENVSTALCREKFHMGEYGCLKAEFYLRRSLGFHLVQSYLPTILIVVISWVSFWLDVESIPARITLGVTTLLTISSKGSGIQSNLPPVSYVKAIDVWMGACTTFVFAALLEFTLVNYLWRKRPPVPGQGSCFRLIHGRGGHANRISHNNLTVNANIEKQPAKFLNTSEGGEAEESHWKGGVIRENQELSHRGGGIAGDIPEGGGPPTTVTIGRLPEAVVVPPPSSPKFQAKRIDQMCRVVFPIFFLIFNLIYWPYYLF